MFINKKIVFLFLIFSNNILSQELIKKEINEVTISSNRAKSDFNYSNVHVIDSLEISNTPVQTLDDLLDYALNIDSRQRGGQGVQSDVSIRAGSFEQTLIMLNGIKMNDPQTGHHNMNIPISLEHIERIEISHGGAGRIYGNYANTGVINIITKKIVPNSIILSSGQNDFKSGEINFNISKDNYFHNILFSNKSSNGYIDGTDYKMYNLFYQCQTQIDSVKLILNSGINNKDFGAYSFYSSKFPNQFESTTTTFASLQINKDGNIGFSNKLYWRKHEDEFILFRDNPSIYQNFHETNVFGLDLNLIQKSKYGSNVIGMEIISNEIISNNLGPELENPILIYDNNFFNKGDNRTITNFFFEKNISINKIHISTGFMININSKFGNQSFPGIDLKYDVNKDIKLHLSHNKSMRTPNFTELYYTSPTNQGNENLNPEESITKEISLNIKKQTHNTSITLFQRDGNNLIDWIMLDGDSVWKTQNLSEIKISGIEISSKINLKSILKSKINYLKVNWSSNKVDTISNGFRSAYILDHLKTNFSISLNHYILNNIMLDWKINYNNRVGDYFDYDYQELKDYNDFWLTSLRISKKLNSNNIIFIDINNLFDKNYLDFGNIPQPKRWARAGIKINF